MKHLISLLAFSFLIGCDGEKSNVAPSKDSPEEAASEAPSKDSLEKQQLEMKLTEIDVAEVSSYSPWNEQVIETAEAITVQEDGQIKPLRTYARSEMMSFHESLTMKVKSGGKIHKIGPVAWLLDCMFRPDLADKLPIFLLDDTEILKPFGIEAEDRRARLSFEDLKDSSDPEENGFTQLVNRGRELLEKQSSEGEGSLSDEEEEVVRFAQLALKYTGIRDSMAMIRGGLPPLDPAQLAYVDQEIYQTLRTTMDPRQFGFWLPILRETIQSTQRLDTPQAREFESELNRQLSFARFGPAWIPPQQGEEKEWQTLEAKVVKFLKKELTDSVEILKDFKKLEAINKASKRPNSEEFLAALKDWQTSLAERAADWQESQTNLAKQAADPDLKYEIEGDAVTITDCDKKVSGELIIPANIEGKPVSSIGNKAFQDCTSLKSITIPDSVTSIGTEAFFACSSLTAVTFLGDAPKIGNDAFKKSSPTIYREADAKDWGDTLAGKPVKLITEKP